MSDLNDEKMSYIKKCFIGKWSEPLPRLGGSRIVEAFIRATEFNSYREQQRDVLGLAT